MSYQVLARKWRPGTFEELTGQEHVSKTLENAIGAKRIAHAYLFSGVRGVGKTTVARILAKSLNCAEGPTPTPCTKCQSCVEISSGFSVDVVEIDGASHTGVDNVRELQENAQYVPLRGRYKIYIIDEVHMLSTSAFNALLKILEEPPPHIIFIFATTEPHKIPATIHSRCQHFQFRRISYREIVERLRYILKEEGIEAPEEALSVVARASDGSMRDALSLLDQAIAYTGGNLAEGDITWILGLADHLTGPFMEHIINKDSAKALGLVRDIVDGGYDLKQFCSNVVEHIRNIILTRLGMGQDVIDLPAEKIAELAEVAKALPQEDLQRLFGIFAKALEEIKWFPYPRFSFEMAVIKATNMRPVVSVDDLLARLADIEARLSGGVSSAGENPPPHNSLQPGEGKLKSVRINPSPQIGKAEEGKGKGEQGFSDETPMSQGLMKENENGEAKASPTQGRGDFSRPFSDEKGSERGEGISDGLDISVIWRNVVKEIHDSKPSLGSYLEQGVPLKYEGGGLFIGFNGGASVFIDLIERKESKDLILNVVKSYIPEVSYIKFSTTHGKENHSSGYTEYITVAHEKKREEIEGVFSEPIVQEAIDILGGELVELRSRRED